MTYVDEHGVKRDGRPNASELFKAVLENGIRAIDAVIDRARADGWKAGCQIVEHKATRGIPLCATYCVMESA